MKKLPQLYNFIIPVKLDFCQIPNKQLEDLLYVNLFPKWEKGIKRLLVAMDIKVDIFCYVILYLESRRKEERKAELCIDALEQQLGMTITTLNESNQLQ